MIAHDSIAANGLHHHLRTAGKGGADMVLLHGWPQTSHCWRGVMEAFEPDYKMIAPDLRGFADSDKPPNPPEGAYDKRTVSEDILAILNARGIEKAILVGHDIGGRVAIRLTLDHPDRVASLIVINGRYPPLGSLRTEDKTQVAQRWYFFFQQYPDLVETLVSNDVRAYYEHFLEHWSHPSFTYAEEDIVEYVRAFSQPGAIRGGCAHYQAALGEDEVQWAEDVGKTIATPTQIIWGADDLVSPPFYTEGYDTVFTDMRLHFVEECGHFPHEEKTDETVSVMRAFLDGQGLAS